MDITETEKGAAVSFDEGTHSSYRFLFARSAFYLFISYVRWKHAAPEFGREEFLRT